MHFVFESECAEKAQLPHVKLGPPVVPFYPFLGEGSPTKIEASWYAYSNLSTGGSRKCPHGIGWFGVGRVDTFRQLAKRRPQAGEPIPALQFGTPPHVAIIGVLFRLVWLKMDGTGLDGVYSRPIYFSKRPPKGLGIRAPKYVN